jgi:transcriptional regulator with XRE-family HTH domain
MTETEIPENLARMFRGIRKQLGLTQHEVGDLLQLSQPVISRIERGTATPTIWSWQRLCNLVGAKLDCHVIGAIDRLEPTVGEMGGFRIPQRLSRNPGSKVRTVRPWLWYMKDALGSEAKVDEYLEHQNLDPDYFVFLDNELNIQFCYDFFDEMIRSGGLRKNTLSQIVAPIGNPSTHGSLCTFYDRARGKVELIDQLVGNAERYDRNFQYKIENRYENGLDISIAGREHLDEFKVPERMGDVLCQYKKQWLRTFSTYGGSTGPVEVNERECMYHGDDQCVYEVKAG